MTMIHDSRRKKYRAPMGAQPCGTQIRLFLETDAPEAIVRFWIDGRAYLYSMKPARGGFEFKFTLPEKPCVVWYYFICGGMFFGNARDDLGGMGELYAHEPPSFQITVYDPAYVTPDWLGEGVMMQIMPDRFCRGGELPCRGRLHTDWYEQPDMCLTENGDNAADDFYGGDLKGICQKLDYIKSLGVTVIYLNPVFMSPSNHKYNTSDYMRVDPAFGTEDDLRALCEKAQAMGIRVILDGVFSHTGSDSVYFNRERNFGDGGAYNSETSPYAGWFSFRKWPDDYKSWWGFDTLPDVDKNSDSFRRFIYGDGDSVCAHWLRTGISGWRLDVADELPMDFIGGFRARMKAEKPDSALIGEVWEDPSRKVAYGALRSYCLGDTLDSTMNYPLRDAILGFFLGRITAGECVRTLESMYENMPPQFYRSTMNLLGSHDKPRALSILADVGNMEPDRKYRRPIELTGEQYALGRQRLIAAWRMVCALPGMPCIYYGDEAGMYGMADPYCRAAYPWGREDKELIEEFRAAAMCRHAHPALKNGSVQLEAVGDDALRIIRVLDREKATLTVNRAAEKQKIKGTIVPACGAVWAFRTLK